MSKLLLLKGQEGLTNRRKSQTEPTGLGLRALWYGTGNGVVWVVAAVVQAAVVVWGWGVGGWGGGVVVASSFSRVVGGGVAAVAAGVEVAVAGIATAVAAVGVAAAAACKSGERGACTVVVVLLPVVMFGWGLVIQK